MGEVKFKPELIPNSKTGSEFVLTENISVPSEYFCSLKHDGARVVIKSTGPALTRALKPVPSKHIQAMVKSIQDYMMPDQILEFEFYAPNMTFSEIMHFFKTGDVTAEKYKKKWDAEWAKTSQGTSTYTKTKDGKPFEQGWEYKGRTPEWLTSWHPELKLYIFNSMTMGREESKLMRNADVQEFMLMYGRSNDVKYIDQKTFDTHEEIQAFYDEAIENNEEGIVIARKSAIYKFGRHTMNSGNIFKMKEDKLEFDGMIIGVEEATKAKEGAEKTINELGRSKTSQKKEDRELSGICKGFLVRMEDGRELTVSLNGFDTEEKKALLVNSTDWIGEWIRFTGMAPVKHGGMPRQARYTKGNKREAKV